MKTIKYFLILSMFLLPNFFITENIFSQDFKPIEQIYLSKNATTGEVDIDETIENINKTITKINIVINNIENSNKEVSLDRIKTIEEDIVKLKNNLPNDIGSFSDNISEIKNEITTINNQINTINNLEGRVNAFETNTVNVIRGLEVNINDLNTSFNTNTNTINRIQNDIKNLNTKFTDFESKVGTSDSVPWSIISGKPDYLTAESNLINKIQSTADLNMFSKKLKLQNINVSTNDFFNAQAIKVAQNIVNTHLLNSRLSGAAAYHALYVNRETGNDTNALYYAMISPYTSVDSRQAHPFKTLDVALRVGYAQGNHVVIYIDDTGRGMHHIRKSTLHALSGAGLHIVSTSKSAQFILIDYDKKASRGSTKLYQTKYKTEYENDVKNETDFFYYWAQYGSYLHLEGQNTGKVYLGMAGTEGLTNKERLEKIPTKFYDYIHPKLSTHLYIAYHGIGVYTKNAEIWARVGLGHNATHNSGGSDLIWMTNSTLNHTGDIGKGKKFQYYMDAYSYDSKTDEAVVEYLTWDSHSLFPKYNKATNVKIGTIYSIPQKP
jgi:prefoldin subunit 5